MGQQRKANVRLGGSKPDSSSKELNRIRNGRTPHARSAGALPERERVRYWLVLAGGYTSLTRRRAAVGSDGGVLLSGLGSSLERTILSLPWDQLGSRPVLLTLTYPDDWRNWVPTGKRLELHRQALVKRWQRRWGERIVGLWAKEFQRAGRPHLHLYVKLPDGVRQSDYLGLMERTKLVKWLEDRFGVYEGRNRAPMIGKQANGKDYGGEFAMWMRTAWAEVVGTQGKLPTHHARGVDARTWFFSEQVAEVQDRVGVAEYLTKEVGKHKQKQPPEGFGPVGRMWGVWSGGVGFKPEAEIERVPAWAMKDLEREMARWVFRRYGYEPDWLWSRRPGDGLFVRGLRKEEGRALLEAVCQEGGARTGVRSEAEHAGRAVRHEMTNSAESALQMLAAAGLVEEGAGFVEDCGVEGG